MKTDQNAPINNKVTIIIVDKVSEPVYIFI